MTDEIYRQDAYVFEFEANVLSVNGDSVVLDATAFYPGGGGQVCDTGNINGMPVKEVFRKGDDIVHIIPDNHLKPGDLIWGSVDWDRRFDLMMGHTGEHLLFSSMKRQIDDLEVVKIFISPESKYAIVNKDIAWEEIAKAVTFANSVIRDNVSVTKTVMSKDDPESEKVRVKMDKIDTDEFTVVDIGDVDSTACCGIHVMETAEIGLIFVDKKVSAGKDGTAVHFKVGRAAEDSSMALASIALRTSDILGTNTENIPNTVSNMKHDADILRSSLKSTIAEYIKQIESEKIGRTDVFSAIIRAHDRDTVTHAAEYLKKENAVAVVVSVTDSISIIIASNVDHVDCKQIITTITAKYGGRGGGKREFAQGGIPDDTSAKSVMNDIKEMISKV